jgi:hypothetical protein
MHQKDQELPHLGNRIKLQRTLGFARVLGIHHGQPHILGRTVSARKFTASRRPVRLVARIRRIHREMPCLRRRRIAGRKGLQVAVEGLVSRNSPFRL